MTTTRRPFALIAERTASTPAKLIFFLPLLLVVVCVATTYGQFHDHRAIFRRVQHPQLGTLDIKDMGEEIKTMMREAGVTKYGYFIRAPLGGVVSEAKGRLNHSGLPFTIDDRFNPASVTKTVTATALLMALEDDMQPGENQFTVLGRKIVDYLPSYWEYDSSITDLNFRDVLSHRTRLNRDEDRITDLTNGGVEEMLQLGTFPDAVGDYSYDNMNYALARVLTVYVLGHEEVETERPEFDEVFNDILISAEFQNFVATQIFDPIGIHDVNFTPEEDGNLFFDLLGGGVGTNYGNWKFREGSAGIQLSIREFAEFQHELWKGRYVSYGMLWVMQFYRVGFGDGSFVADDGIAMGHGGIFPGRNRARAELWTTHRRFSSGVEVYFMMNARVIEENGELSTADAILMRLFPDAYQNAIMIRGEDIVIRAYNAAWKKRSIFRPPGSTGGG